MKLKLLHECAREFYNKSLSTKPRKFATIVERQGNKVYSTIITEKNAIAISTRKSNVNILKFIKL